VPLDIYAFLAKRVRTERLRRGWTLEHLAAAADISPGFLAYIEQNKRKASLTTIEHIARALDVSLSEIFRDAPTPLRDPYKMVHQLESLLREAPPSRRAMMLRVLKTISRSG
jgi:transcriptional regulator with XRE-family HTH domain